WQRHRIAAFLRLVDGLLANSSQIASDLIGQHLPKPKPEEVRRIAAVRPCGDIATYARRPPWASMTHRTTVRQTSANRIVNFNITCAVAFVRPLALYASKLALKELASAPNRTKWIAVNDEDGRARSVRIAAPSANFILQRLGDTGLSGIWRQGAID